MSGRVFVVQRPVVRNYGSAQGIDEPRWSNKYDLSPAKKFGRLVDVLPVGATPSRIGELVRAIEQALGDFDDGDYLLCVGDPVAIAVASITASRRVRSVRVLKWDRREGAYSAHDLVMG